MNIGKQFKEGLLTQNPVLVQMLGLCSTMAITTSIMNGLGMGVSVQGHVRANAGARSGQQRASAHLKLELVVVSSLIWVLGTELESPGRASSALNR